MYPCPCCGFLTRSEEALGTFDICPVCGWEDDYLQGRDLLLEGGANTVSLAEARRNFADFGAKSRLALPLARKHLPAEIPAGGNSAQMMSEANVASAKFGDLLLTITRYGECWRAHVKEVDDPDGGLSDGTDHASPDRAKRASVAIARELFGTNVPEERLEWRPTPTGN